MLKKVLIFKTERGEFCVMNVPDNYRRSDQRPHPESQIAYPRYFPDHSDAVTEAHARHGRAALIIDETH